MPKSTIPEEKMSTDNPFAMFTGEMTEKQKEAAAAFMANAGLPPFAGLSNLSAHPMAAMAAATAIGAGMASQMLGMMAGAMAGAIEASRMLANEKTGGLSEPLGAANPLNFDPASGSFDDTKEEDPITHQPPVKADAPKAEPVAAKLAPAAEPIVVKPAAKVKPAAAAKPVAAKKPVAKAVAPVKKTAKPVVAAAPKAAKPAPAAEPVATAKAAKPAKAEPIATGKIEPILPEDFVKPKPQAKPDMPDDLKQISGIGPKLESVLNSLGIWTWGRIAAMTPQEVAWVDDYLQFKGRIERDEWIAQALALAGKK